MATRKDIEAYLSQEVRLNALAKAAFETLDTDHSGFIDRDELAYMMIQTAKDVGANLPSQTDIDFVFDKLDTDRDDKISLDEFKILIVRVLRCILDHDMVSN